MKFINTDGLAFIGPGSEWFWTALSGLILAGTFIAIYRQLRLQAHANAVEQLSSFEHEWDSERHALYQIDVLVALRNGAQLEQVPAAVAAAAGIGRFWERVGALCKGGHVNLQLLWDGDGRDCRLWWATLRPWINTIRAEANDETIFMWFERIADEMKKIDDRMHVPPIDEARLARFRKHRIDICQSSIRTAQSLRSVMLASPEAMTVEPPAPVTPPTQAA